MYVYYRQLYILTACFGTKSNFMFAQRFRACSLLNNDCNESRSRNGWSFCTPFTSMGNCKSIQERKRRCEKIRKIGPMRCTYVIIIIIYSPSYICAYCGNPAALSHLHASLASISVTKTTKHIFFNTVRITDGFW